MCCSYLDRRESEYASIITQVADKRRKIPPEIATKFKIISRNRAILEAQIDSGKLLPRTYIGLLKGQLKKDLVLVEYLKTLGQCNRVMIVKERISCIQNELASFQTS
eukprot:TRINITY_DN11654_c0_g1_i2.p1 TRINITY_DN11654_c0_g1~~TRINITY_DN11654_c0_g1_i2.p1  ORF type:complete len:107 (-),score=37.24 TRINITY_DN11654_c0_g1_i2:202-522(-)